MSSIRSHLTFANVVASLALFIALGGGAYAATSGALVGSGGTIHGCVLKNGTLSVVKAGKKCPKHTSTLVFDQKGPQGSAGVRGATGAAGTAGSPGAAGTPGAAGPGATSYYMTVAQPNDYSGVTLANGLIISGGCPGSTGGAGNAVFLELAAEPDTHNIGGIDLQASGTEQADGATLTGLNFDDAGGIGPLEAGNDTVDLDVIGRSSQTTSNTFYRVDFHADYDSGTSSCKFWGVTVPAG